MFNYIIRRRKLGKTSCRAIKLASTTSLRVRRNDYTPRRINILFRWGCTSPAEATTVINKSEAIHRVNDKAGFRHVLNSLGLSPRTWTTSPPPADAYPVIVRPARHAQGRNLYLCNSQAEMLTATLRCGSGSYVSEYIKKVAEFRVYVVSGRVIAVAQKTPGNPADIAWNVARGGRFDNVKWSEWPLPSCVVAIQAFNLSGLDFGGVDVMVDEEGKPYVLEINSAPSLTSPYRQSCTAKAFDWIVNNGKDHFPPLEGEVRSYKDIIHPAIREDENGAVRTVGSNPTRSIRLD